MTDQDHPADQFVGRTIAPPKIIAKAMGEIQKNIPQLVYDARNEFAGYDYVSIDGYYAQLRPLLSEHGIQIVPTEERSGISADGKTLKVTFAFYVLHESGEIWNFPIRHSVFVPYQGAQSAGSAMSYADKFVMRTLFKIPTGDQEPEAKIIAKVNGKAVAAEDADAMPKQKVPGQNPTLDYDYNGPPYRMFDKNMTITQTFTAIKPYGMALKAKTKTGDVQGLLKANADEINRVREDINHSGDLTPKAKETLKQSFAQFDQLMQENNDA